MFFTFFAISKIFLRLTPLFLIEFMGIKSKIYSFFPKLFIFNIKINSTGLRNTQRATKLILALNWVRNKNIATNKKIPAANLVCVGKFAKKE